MAIVSVQELTLGFGGHPLLDRVTLHIEKGDRISLLGRNGTGKSTLMRLINREIRPDSGKVVTETGVRTARLPQEVPTDISGTILTVVVQGLSDEADKIPEWEIRTRAETILSKMQLDGDEPFQNLSAGLKRRALLAQTLVAEPDLLLLDEPTNHLDIEAIKWLEDFLGRHGPTLIFIAHDREFVRRLATKIAQIDRGHLNLFECSYDTFLERKEAVLADEAARLHRADKKLAAEEVWVRQGIKARRTRNEGRVRALEGLREERRQRRAKAGSVKMRAQEAERTGKLVIEAQHLDYSFGPDAVLKDFSTVIQRGDKIGIMGPNGCGKTTLLNLLLGNLHPDNGNIRHGLHLEIAYFDQLREQLDEEKSVQENVAGKNDKVIIDGNARHIIGYLGDFLFTPERARSPVSILSGGERNRLLLAKLFTRPANVLVLDEPTNDLDMETLELLEELLVAYRGTLLLVSHDRTFLNNVVTGIYAFEGDGRVEEYVGGYDDWLRQQTGAPAPSSRKEKPEKTAPSKPKASDKSRKLSYKEQQELEALPGRIEAMEAEQAEIHATLSDPDFYREKSPEVAKLKDRLETLEKELFAAYARWEELEAIGE